MTAPFVQKIFEDYAAGKPMVEIAEELNSLGVTTVRGKYQPLLRGFKYFLGDDRAGIPSGVTISP